MRLCFAIGSSVAALMLISGALADELPAPAAGNKTVPATPAAAAIVQIAAVSRDFAQIASTAVVAPPAPESAGPPETTALVAAPTAETITESSRRPERPPSVVARKDTLAVKPDKHTRLPQLAAAAAPRPAALRVVGKTETGKAAWYGGRYIGRRTTSGERLDTTHATCAHRSLPLNSLARVTNLRNGRSVVVRVNDRGPLAESLLIDMSPRAADELKMKEAGLVDVRVEQVVEVPSDSK
jgi:rare lipoprotein A